MALWDECPDCKGVGGHWDFHTAPGVWRQKWVPCEPCEGQGRVRVNLGPVDDIEEECTRG